MEPPSGMKKLDEKPLPIRYVKGMDWQALASNVVTALVIFVVMFKLIRLKTDNPMLTMVIPFSVIWILLLFFYDRLGTNVKGREGLVYLDNISRELIVYLKGFHFTAWFSKKENDTLGFQKHEVKKAIEKEGSGIVIATQDGYQVIASLELMYNRRNSPEALSKSLRYELPELTDWIWALTIGRLSDLAACNSYATLLYCKAEVAGWLANLYGGEGHISPIEDDTGTAIKNPVLTALNPTPESFELFKIQARAKAVANGYEALIAAGMSPEEAEIVAQTSADTAIREIYTYQGIPENAEVVALGSSGIAVASNRRNKKGENKS